MSMLDIPDNIVNLPDRVKALENQITSLSNHPEYVADAVISKSLQALSNSINDSKKDILTAKILQKSAQDRKILDINLDKNNPESLLEICGLLFDFNIKLPTLKISKPNINFKIRLKSLPTYKFQLKFCQENASSILSSNISKVDKKSQKVDLNLIGQNAPAPDIKDSISDVFDMYKKDLADQQKQFMSDISDAYNEFLTGMSTLTTGLIPSRSALMQSFKDSWQQLLMCRLQFNFKLPLNPCQKQLLKKVKKLLQNQVLRQAVLNKLNAAGVDTSKAEMIINTAEKLNGALSDNPDVIVKLIKEHTNLDVTDKNGILDTNKLNLSMSYNEIAALAKGLVYGGIDSNKDVSVPSLGVSDKIDQLYSLQAGVFKVEEDLKLLKELDEQL